jgi:hypothetical protein
MEEKTQTYIQTKFLIFNMGSNPKSQWERQGVSKWHRERDRDRDWFLTGICGVIELGL